MKPSHHWEHFHHAADIGVRGRGATKSEAFAQVALALTGVVTEPQTVQAVQSVSVAREAPDDEMLLLDWLNAIVFEMATRRMLFGRFEVEVEPGRLRGTIWGEPVDVARHQPAVEIKGATCTELRVRPTDDGGWEAQCVVDV